MDKVQFCMALSLCSQDEHDVKLEETREAMLSERVTTIQRVWRGYKQRIYFKKLKKACVIIQKAWKKFSVRRKYIKVRYPIPDVFVHHR